MNEVTHTDLTKEEPADPTHRADLVRLPEHQSHGAVVSGPGFTLRSFSREPATSSGALATAAFRLSLAVFLELTGAATLASAPRVPPLAVLVLASLCVLGTVFGAGGAIVWQHVRETRDAAGGAPDRGGP
ncbi:hypothetical protein [Actinomadura parmotrematis]|uniref:Uncharacterized protein n=1 Tax=Actinomadura parmotrematis TaxID=2864039 RepID=A0ABS7FTT4_9ACTN|nr:hypothetical protein [Actinomadura parmotrematis]MBW8482997.1 hypothetical protein [Actinomadura parmotrematis]